MKYIFIVITTCFNILIYNAQEYFQQKVDTYINVELDDENHFLRGFEKMVYHNQSNSTLDSIVIHLWPNAYKNSSTELAKQKYEDGSNQFKYAKDKDLGFIDSLDFNVNGSKVEWNYIDGKIDICVISLKKTILSLQIRCFTMNFTRESTRELKGYYELTRIPSKKPLKEIWSAHPRRGDD